MTYKKLNILFLASWYPNTESTQAGNFIQQHAEAVSKFVNAVVIHTVAINSNEQEKITDELVNNVREIIVYYPRSKGSTSILSKISKSKQQEKAYQKAYNIALKHIEKFDIIHLNACYPAGLFALNIIKKEGLPLVVSEHWTAFLPSSKTSFSLIEKKIIKKIYAHAAVICPVSEHLKQAMITFGIDANYKVIPNVVNENLFNYNTKLTASNTTEILHISNFKDNHKNITGILKTIKKISDKRNDFKLTLAGNGNTTNFEKLANRLKIPNEVYCFKNDQTRSEVASLMKQSDFFLLFSNYETFSVVIAEAWCCGLPVVASKCGGLTEEISESNGITVSPKDEEALYAAINKMIDKKNNYNYQEISSKALQQFSFEAVGQSFMKIYQDLNN